jgi:hypothetical protein
MEIFIILIFLALGVAAVVAGIQGRMQIKPKVAEVTFRHMDVLARKREQSVYLDDYGKVVSDRWWPEVDYFLEHQVLPELMVKPKFGTPMWASMRDIVRIKYRRIYARVLGMLSISR